MIWLLPTSLPTPSVSKLSLFLSLHVVYRRSRYILLPVEGGRGAKSYDCEKVWILYNPLNTLRQYLCALQHINFFHSDENSLFCNQNIRDPEEKKLQPFKSVICEVKLCMKTTLRNAYICLV